MARNCGSLQCVIINFQIKTNTHLTAGWTVRGSNPGRDEILRPFVPVLRPTQLPVQWVMEVWSYTSTHPLGHIGPVTGSFYLYLYLFNKYT